MKQFITSDTHFFHNNIIRYCNRPYRSVVEMNEDLIAKWNNVVGPDDEIYHLGDFCFGNFAKAQSVFDRLNGKKILLRGNHDPKHVLDLGWLNVHNYLYLTHGPVQLYLSHYPGAKHRADIALHGHEHGNGHQTRHQVDVGVDCWNMSPMLIDDLLEVAKTFPTTVDAERKPRSEKLINRD